MPLKMRGNAAISRECWEMCPHTAARLRAPAANRLKYSERRKGLCARSSAVSASNQPSVVMPGPPFRRPDYIERAPSQAAGSRDARGRPPVTGGVLERVREANQRRLAPRTAQQRQAEGRSVGRDRKSTRLNSSHQIISYAVFCLKKKSESTCGIRSARV